MPYSLICILLLVFGTGMLIGCLIAYVLVRRSINQNMKSLSQIINVIGKHKAVKEQDGEIRKENLLLLANKLKNIESNIQKIRQKEYGNYIVGLNRLLNSIGIAEIKRDD